MKKFTAFLAAICAAVVICAFAGCKNDERQPAVDKIGQGYSVCYAFTASADETAITDGITVYDYMRALSAGGKIVFEGNQSTYGFYVTSVLGLSEKAESTANSYKGYAWALYTTVTSLDGVIYSQDDATFIYGGITLYKASYGVSGVPCVAGETYALVYEFNEYSW